MSSRLIRCSMLAVLCCQPACGLFGLDPDGDDGNGGGECADQEELLAGQWITPEGSTTSSSSYNLVTYTEGAGISVYQWADGYSNQVDYQAWRITSTPEGTCDKIEVDYDGSGWLPDYSRIHELTLFKLDIEATDGTYYGTQTRYDRWGDGSDDGDTGESGTCRDYCEPTDPDSCSAGEACLNSADGYICLPPECQSCWDQGLSCSSYPDSCQFDACTE